MKLIKKLIAWFEDLLWAGAIEDVFGDHEYIFDTEDQYERLKTSGLSRAELSDSETMLTKIGETDDV